MAYFYLPKIISYVEGDHDLKVPRDNSCHSSVDEIVLDSSLTKELICVSFARCITDHVHSI